MRIGILSDTHVPEAPLIFPEILEALEGVDLIFHAGDLVVARVLDELEQIAPVYAAEGNHDPHLADDPRIEPVHHLELEGFSIALLHIFEPLHWDLDKLLKQYLDGIRPDIIVCGDTHFERIDILEDVLVVNPGSATLPHNMSPRLGHVAYLTIEAGAPPHAEIVDLAAPDWRARAKRAVRSPGDRLS